MPIACSDELVVAEIPSCDDITYPLGIEPSPPLPAPEFAVECAQGWGHGIEGAPASATSAMPGDHARISPHPGGGWLVELSLVDAIVPAGTEWDQWKASHGLVGNFMWVDQAFTSVHWSRDYDEAFIDWTLAAGDDGPELWTERGTDVGHAIERLDVTTGALLEEQLLAWPEPAPDHFTSFDLADSWSGQGSWLYAMDSSTAGDEPRVSTLLRMAEFGELETIHAVEWDTPGFPILRSAATPDDGLLWIVADTVHAIAGDGSVRWSRQLGAAVAVDAEGGFLVATSVPLDETEQLWALTVERRLVEDASVQWSHTYHRFDLVGDPVIGPFEQTDATYLLAASTGAVARADGYLLFMAGAYPHHSCRVQPMVLALDLDGTVKWGHEVEVCGSMGAMQGQGLGQAGRWVSMANGGVVIARGTAIDATHESFSASWLRTFQ